MHSRGIVRTCLALLEIAGKILAQLRDTFPDNKPEKQNQALKHAEGDGLELV